MLHAHQEESRLIFLMRSDITLRISDVTFALADAMRRHFALSLYAEHRERLNFYQNIQRDFPKICKRYKAKDIDRVVEHVNSLSGNMPVVSVKWDNHVIGYIVGPSRASELPPYLQSLQLMTKSLFFPAGTLSSWSSRTVGDEIDQFDTTINTEELHGFEREAVEALNPTVNIYYRTDIEIPYGKLIPQIGHALQKFWMERTVEDTLLDWNFTLIETDLSGLFENCLGTIITDAGRTHFDKPTPTMGYKITNGR